MDDGGNLLTEFPDQMALFFQVSLTQPNQAYFMIGYPIAFLGKLYLATQNDAYLQTAKGYLDVALGCHEMISQCYLSHKVAWGAAIMANITHDHKYANLSIKIADYLLTIQQEQGLWLKNTPAHTCFDQTAEIAIWLREIITELSTVLGF
jgi:rhamnogalacturonyl hydrolase YesR